MIFCIFIIYKVYMQGVRKTTKNISFRSMNITYFFLNRVYHQSKYRKSSLKNALCSFHTINFPRHFLKKERKNVKYYNIFKTKLLVLKKKLQQVINVGFQVNSVWFHYIYIYHALRLTFAICIIVVLEKMVSSSLYSSPTITTQ